MPSKQRILSLSLSLSLSLPHKQPTTCRWHLPTSFVCVFIFCFSSNVHHHHHLHKRFVSHFVVTFGCLLIFSCLAKCQLCVVAIFCLCLYVCVCMFFSFHQNNKNYFLTQKIVQLPICLVSHARPALLANLSTLYGKKVCSSMSACQPDSLPACLVTVPIFWLVDWQLFQVQIIIFCFFLLFLLFFCVGAMSTVARRWIPQPIPKWANKLKLRSSEFFS